MPKVTLFYAQSDPLVTLNDLCPKRLKIYALSDPPAVLLYQRYTRTWVDHKSDLICIWNSCMYGVSRAAGHWQSFLGTVKLGPWAWSFHCFSDWWQTATWWGNLNAELPTACLWFVEFWRGGVPRNKSSGMGQHRKYDHVVPNPLPENLWERTCPSPHDVIWYLKSRPIVGESVHLSWLRRLSKFTCQVTIRVFQDAEADRMDGHYKNPPEVAWKNVLSGFWCSAV